MEDIARIEELIFSERGLNRRFIIEVSSNIAHLTDRVVRQLLTLVIFGPRTDSSPSFLFNRFTFAIHNSSLSVSAKISLLI